MYIIPLELNRIYRIHQSLSFDMELLFTKENRVDKGV